MNPYINKILVTGDVHGNTGAWKFNIFPAAKKAGVDLILQVGDFGFWSETEKYIVKLSRYATNWEIPVYWLDGNHENYDALERIGAFDADTEVEVAPNVFYLPRGFRWTWWDKTFMSLGGAYSVDKAFRVPGKSWWPQEDLTLKQAYRAIQGGPVDVLFTHEAPAGIDVPGVHAAHKIDIPGTFRTREYLAKVVRETAPELLFHGHHHVGYVKDGIPIIVGLNAEGRFASTVSLDVPSLDWRMEL